MNKNIAELGDLVECKITGFKGVVTSHAKCLTGCDRLTVQPKVEKDGKYPDSIWIDQAAVKVIKKGFVKASVVQDELKKGGPPSRGSVK